MAYQIKKKIIISFFITTLFFALKIFASGSSTGATAYYGTHTYNNTASLHTTATSPSITSPLHTIDITQGIGTLDIEVSPSLQIQTGFESWTGGSPYFDASTVGSFTLLSAGTGYINTSPVPNSTSYSWTAPQTVTGLTAGNTYYIYIDSTGTLQKTTTDSNTLRENNVVLFEVLRDSTSSTNIQYVVKENNSFRMPVATYEYLNDNIGAIIQNDNDGANIVLNGTQKIQINGADVLNDSGLLTTIPDSAGIGVTWRQMFTNAGGKWATSTTSDTFTGQWNNLGTITSLSAGQYAVYTLYVAKDNLNSSAAQYFAVINVAQYGSLVAANAAITAGIISKATVELAALELAQLGYIIYSQASNSIVSVQIQKTTLGSSISSGGTTNASLIITNTATFDGILSAADTNVQAALETIDEWGKNATNNGVLIGRGVNTPIAAVASISPSGIPLISQGAGVDPAYSTAVVAGGGTGVTTMTTAYAPVISGTTATGPLQVASTGLSTAGFVLTSNGAAAVPSFQSVASAGALTMLTGDTGGAISPTAGNINLFGSHGINTSGSGSTITTAVNNTLTLGDLSAVVTGSPSLTLTTGDLTISSGNINLPTTSAAGADGVVNVNSTRFMHSFGTNNSFVGSAAGNYTLTATGSTGIGKSALTVLSSGLNNTAVGANAGQGLTSGGQNTVVGAGALLTQATTNDSTAVGYNALTLSTAAQNTAVGSQAMSTNTIGTPNTAVGYNALGGNVSGANNTAVGANAALALTVGTCTAIGSSSMGGATATGGDDCTAVGYNALGSATWTGASNTVVGSQAGAGITSGSQNTAVGKDALKGTTTANTNTAVGYSAFSSNINGTRTTAIGGFAMSTANCSDCVGIGYGTLTGNTASNNVAVGVLAAQSVNTANNTAVGRQALNAASGADSTAVGYQALLVNTGAQSTAVGSQAMAANSSGTLNTAVGYKASNLNQTGIQNTAVGYQALMNNITNNNTGIGAQVLQSTTSGDNNTAVGYAALFTNQTGTNNTGVGDHAFYFSTASSNTGVGSTVGQQTTTGARNTAVGHAAFFTNQTGANNTAIGYNALNLNTASQNTTIGSGSMAANTSGTPNTAVGYNALSTNQTGSNLVAIGANALAASTGNQNTALGSNAGLITTGIDNVYVGYNAGSTATTGNNNIFIGSGVAPITAVTDTGTTIIGNASTAVAYLRGVYGVTPATSGTVMLIDSASKLGAVTSQGTANQVLTSNGAGVLPTWADNIVQTATVTLSAAQVNALNVTPIQVIAAPAAGKMIYVINAALKLTHVTTAFSAGGTIDLIYNGLSSDPIVPGLGSNAFVTVGSNRVMGGVSGGQVSVASSSVEAVAVQIFNPGSAFTGGGTSTIKVMVNYVVLTT
ncbi:hypothetical protein KBB68_00760 [Candidatus Babeliales bacterium]|nr:hypothetical protein [Candidatus Babeliales bacterium]